MKKHNENRSEPERKFFFRSESATATAIGAVLLLGIIFLVLTIIWVEWVPEWKNDAEYSHMDVVGEDMAELKSRIDMMAIVLASTYSNCSPLDDMYSNASPLDDMYSNASPVNTLYSNPPAPNLVTSVPLHMGGGGVPFIRSTEASGILAINKDKCVMKIIVNPQDDEPYTNSVNCGTVTYQSKNHYYVDQAYSYENGAVVLSQNGQSVIMLYPSIQFSRASADEYNLSINSIRIFEKPYAPAQTVSSNIECSLLLTGMEYLPLYDSDTDGGGNVNGLILTISSSHPKAWMIYLEKTLKDAGISDYNLSKSPDSNNVRLTIPQILDSKKNNEGKKNETTSDILKRLYIGETVVKVEPGINLN